MSTKVNENFRILYGMHTYMYSTRMRRHPSTHSHMQGIDKNVKILSILYFLTKIFTNSRWVILGLCEQHIYRLIFC